MAYRGCLSGRSSMLKPCGKSVGCYTSVCTQPTCVDPVNALVFQVLSLETHLACHAGNNKVCVRPFVGSVRTGSAPGTTLMQAGSETDSLPSTRRTALQLALALGKSCLPPTCEGGRWLVHEMTNSAYQTNVHHRDEASPPDMVLSFVQHSSHRQLCWQAGVLAAHPPAAEAIKVPECEELTTAGNGIQFCDTKEGTGKAPAKGALIRSSHVHGSAL